MDLLASFFLRSCVVSRLCPWPRGLPATAVELSCRYLRVEQPIPRRTRQPEQALTGRAHSLPGGSWERTHSLGQDTRVLTASGTRSEAWQGQEPSGLWATLCLAISLLRDLPADGTLAKRDEGPASGLTAAHTGTGGRLGDGSSPFSILGVAWWPSKTKCTLRQDLRTFSDHLNCWFYPELCAQGVGMKEKSKLFGFLLKNLLWLSASCLQNESMPSLCGEASRTKWAVLWESQGQDGALGFHPWLGLQWRRDHRQVLGPSGLSPHWKD